MIYALRFLLAALPVSLSAATEFPPAVPADVHDALVAKKLKEIDEVIAAGPFKPTTESLSKIGIPEWYADAKFGIFIHWGVYSVPSFGSEWYPRKMYDPTTPEFKHHEKTYGPVSKFGYKDFIPMFKAEKFDPTAWAKLFKESGAKYVMPVAEHHDGFSMYNNPFTRWNSVNLGPKRDVGGELLEATRAEGLKTAVSSHRAFNWPIFSAPRIRTISILNSSISTALLNPTSSLATRPLRTRTRRSPSTTSGTPTRTARRCSTSSEANSPASARTSGRPTPPPATPAGAMSPTTNTNPSDRRKTAPLFQGQDRAHFGHTYRFPTKNPEAFRLRDLLFHKGKCSKEDSNLHRLPY